MPHGRLTSSALSKRDIIVVGGSAGSTAADTGPEADAPADELELEVRIAAGARLGSERLAQVSSPTGAAPMPAAGYHPGTRGRR